MDDDDDTINEEDVDYGIFEQNHADNVHNNIGGNPVLVTER